MNKDALLATAIGFFIGLCITGLLLAGPSIMKMMPNIRFTMPQLAQNKSKKSPTLSPAPGNASFAVTGPLNESIESEQSLLVSGTAKAKTKIVIQGNTDDAVVTASEDNTFAGKITLSEGKNNIVITNYSDGAAAGKTIVVYYTPETL